jgi:formate dehydrogenase maturation protein FdhE
VAFSALARSEVEMKLGQAALDFANGVWRSDDEVLDDQAMQDYYVAAVAYRSSEHKPGVWIDAYPHEPNVQEVLQNLYEEFDENGEIADVSFDDFLRLAVPNVEILGPDQTRYFVRRKSEA